MSTVRVPKLTNTRTRTRTLTCSYLLVHQCYSDASTYLRPFSSVTVRHGNYLIPNSEPLGGSAPRPHILIFRGVFLNVPLPFILYVSSPRSWAPEGVMAVPRGLLTSCLGQSSSSAKLGITTTNTSNTPYLPGLSHLVSPTHPTPPVAWQGLKGPFCPSISRRSEPIAPHSCAFRRNEPRATVPLAPQPSSHQSHVTLGSISIGQRAMDADWSWEGDETGVSRSVQLAAKLPETVGGIRCGIPARA